MHQRPQFAQDLDQRSEIVGHEEVYLASPRLVGILRLSVAC
ncbi:hypothetical protein [Lysobacter gummosus]